ncbi:AAA family ATPase [Serratia fonticola]
MTRSPQKPTLHLLCGKIASGKSTLSAKLATQPGSVIIAEDRWLAQLYAEEMQTVADYVRCSTKLKNAIKPHLIALLNAGVTLILDFPANTVANREWMMDIIRESGADNQLHYLNAPDDVCKARLHARNQSGTHDFAATDAQFDLITRHFVEPNDQEGFNIIQHS